MLSKVSNENSMERGEAGWKCARYNRRCDSERLGPNQYRNELVEVRRGNAEVFCWRAGKDLDFRKVSQGQARVEIE